MQLKLSRYFLLSFATIQKVKIHKNRFVFIGTGILDHKNITTQSSLLGSVSIAGVINHTSQALL